MSLIIAIFFSITALAVPINEKKAPDFVGITADDEEIRLSGFRGKTVVLEWTNHQCPFVRKHYSSGNMQRTQRTLTEEGVVWISIVSSAPGEQGHVSAEEANRLTASRGGYASHVVLDPQGKIGRLYDAKTTPHMFVVDAAGVLRYQGAIDDKPSANRRSLENAKNYVLQAWSELKTGQPVSEAHTKAYGCTVKYGVSEISD